MRILFDPSEGEQSGGGVATPEIETPQAGAEQVAAGGEGEQGAPDWQTQALPAGHWGHAKGLKTLGDLDRTYQESSSEARRLGETARQYEERSEKMTQAYVESLLQVGKAQGGQQQQAPAAKGSGVWGFPSREAYSAAYQADPEAAMEKTLLHYLEKSPAFKEKMLEIISPELRSTLEPLQEKQAAAEHEQFVRQAEQIWNRFQTEWPNFKPGTPLYQQLDKELNSNPVLAKLARQDYGQALELAAARIERSVTRQQAVANEQKMKETRRGAGSARPGAGGATTAKGGTIVDRIKAHAAQRRAAGEQVTDEQIEDAISRATGVVGVK